MSCAFCMRKLVEEKARRLRDENKVIMELVEKLRLRGWDAQAHFIQDENIHVYIRRIKS